MSDLKRFIVEEGDWEILELRLNGGYDTLALQKHGTHDQSTHNPWKHKSFMRGWAAGKWKKIEGAEEQNLAYIEQQATVFAYQTKQRTGLDLNEAEAQQLGEYLQSESLVAARKAKLENAELWQNGSTLLLVKRDVPPDLTNIKNGIVQDREISGLLSEIDRMQRDYPIPGITVHVDNSEYAKYGKDINNVVMFAHRGGAFERYEPHIFVRTKSMRDSWTQERSKYFANPDGMISPNDRRVSLTHEWGHVLDKKSPAGYNAVVGKDFEILQVVNKFNKEGTLVPDAMSGGAMKYMSVYGSSDPAEHFADSFASFAIHKQKAWKLTNPLTIEMAKEFKW